ncbi:MAG TPA: phosphopantothenoylcysteine decarboxylase, partial [Vicinamibacterales bacterium]|nr:phosphopantothenoylcysteine decarboxylase [Vicinamibacterales bacterium]
KLARKKADLIVANDVSRSDAGFDVDTNAVTIVSDSAAVEVPLASKADIAARILDAIEPLVARLAATGSRL